MKKLIYGLVLFITSISITSCMEDGPYGYDTTMGEFMNEQLFVTDLGQKYTITENTSGFSITLNLATRCLASFEISEKVDENNFNVKLLSANTSEISNIINIENFDEESVDNNFGTLPVNIYSLFQSGGYLNLISQFHYIDEETPHHVYLLYDKAKSDANNVFLELRHKVAQEIEEEPTQSNLTQFKIYSYETSEINANTADKFHVTITYKWYDKNAMPGEDVKVQTLEFDIDKANFNKANLEIK